MSNGNKAGARAAAEYFIALTPHVLSTLDTSEWDAMRLPDCVFCERVASDAEKYRAASERELGGKVSIVSSSVMQGTDTSFLVHIAATEEPTRVVDSAGETVRDNPPPASLSLDVLMHRKGGEWRVRAVTVND